MNKPLIDQLDSGSDQHPSVIPPDGGPRQARNRLHGNIAALSVLQLLNYALPVVVVPYLGRVLGPAHYGLLIFSQATVNYANSVTDYGFNYSATRLVARHRGERDQLSRIFWSATSAKALLLFLSLAVMAFLVAIDQHFAPMPR
jgi:polysaccharide transporter, PST family